MSGKFLKKIAKLGLEGILAGGLVFGSAIKDDAKAQGNFGGITTGLCNYWKDFNNNGAVDYPGEMVNLKNKFADNEMMTTFIIDDRNNGWHTITTQIYDPHGNKIGENGSQLASTGTVWWTRYNQDNLNDFAQKYGYGNYRAVWLSNGEMIGYRDFELTQSEERKRAQQEAEAAPAWCRLDLNYVLNENNKTFVSDVEYWRNTLDLRKGQLNVSIITNKPGKTKTIQRAYDTNNNLIRESSIERDSPAFQDSKRGGVTSYIARQNFTGQGSSIGNPPDYLDSIYIRGSGDYILNVELSNGAKCEANVTIITEDFNDFSKNKQSKAPEKKKR